MKVYVIGKFEQKEEVREVYRKLREIGYEITYDWTNHKTIQPYSENPQLANEYSEEEMKAITESDIVIYLSTREGTTSKLEVGGAMLLNFIGKNPKRIYLVGEHNTASPWFMNKRVIRFNSVDEVIANLKNCPYCNEFRNGFEFEYENKNYGRRLLFESDNFVVFPSVGQIVEGYLIIAPKKHYISMGQIPSELHSELNLICEKVKQVLSENYEMPIFFEHGDIPESEGNHLVHGHFHVVPAKVDLLNELEGKFEYRKISSFVELRKQFDKGIPYFYYESNSGEKFLFEVPEKVPSQYIRKIIALEVGKPEIWNWKTNPEIDKILNTVEKLKDKF